MVLQGCGISLNVVILPVNIIYGDFRPFGIDQKLTPKSNFRTLSRNFLSARNRAPSEAKIGFRGGWGRGRGMRDAAIGVRHPLKRGYTTRKHHL